MKESVCQGKNLAAGSFFLFLKVFRREELRLNTYKGTTGIVIATRKRQALAVSPLFINKAITKGGNYAKTRFDREKVWSLNGSV